MEEDTSTLLNSTTSPFPSLPFLLLPSLNDPSLPPTLLQMLTPTPRDLRSPLILHQHFLIPFLLLHFTLVLTNSNAGRYVRKLAFPVVFAVTVNPIFTATSHIWGIAFLSGAALFFQTLMVVNYLLVVDVYSDPRFRLEETSEDPATLGFFKRNVWVFKLLISARGVGWKYRPRGVAEPVDRSRLGFWIRGVVHGTVCYLLMDAFSYITTIDPFFREQGCWKGVSPFLILPDVETRGVLDGRCYPGFVDEGNTMGKMAWFVFRNCCVSFEVYGLLTSMYDVLSIIAVCVLRIDEPKNWPPLFGSISSVFSGRNAGLRNFWGRFWHQSFRMQMLLPSEAIVGSDPITPPPTPSTTSVSNGHTTTTTTPDTKKQKQTRNFQNQIKMLTTFINSGLLHFCGCATLGVPGYGSFAFFFLQAFGVFLEDIFVPRNPTMRVLWMVLWIQLTCSFFFCDLLNGEKGDGWNAPLSLWRLLDGGVGEMWTWGDPRKWYSWDASAWGWGVSM